MESNRQKKVSSLIQKEMSILFQKMGSEFLNTIITVTVVRISPDIGNAKIYISIFPKEKQIQVYDMIKEKLKLLRYELGRRIKDQIRKIPDLQFYIDDSLDYAEHINELLKK
jgi:ribosome-binding factor A